MNVKTARALVLGLGNDLLGDDGVGLRVVRELAGRVGPQVELLESGEAGLALLEIMLGYETVVIVDAIQTGTQPPGHVYVYGPGDFGHVVAPSAHYAGLPEVLELGRRLGVDMPTHIHVVAVEVEDPYSFRECLTPLVEAAVEPARTTVLSLL